MGGIQRFTGVGGYGKSLKDDYRRFYGATVNFAGRGEMIPNEDTYCEIDPNVVDTYGIPVLRFHASGAHEVNQAKHMQETFREIIRTMGGTPLSPMPTREPVRPRTGRAHHPRGGDDEDGQRSADVGAERALPGARREEPLRRRRGPVRLERHKNCTWTILALAMRTSEFIAQQRNRGTL